MKKILIDLGANNGMSVSYFKNLLEDFDEYEVHCFECNPKFFNLLEKNSKIILHKKAAWVKNEKINFYIDKSDHSLGSTLIKKKKTDKLNKKFPLVVDAIDISEWIKENISEEDYVILKIDIEGAEYEVFKKMDEDKTLALINELYGEFHLGKVGKTKKDANNVKNMLLTKYNIVFKDHDSEKKK